MQWASEDLLSVAHKSKNYFMYSRNSCYMTSRIKRPLKHQSHLKIKPIIKPIIHIAAIKKFWANIWMIQDYSTTWFPRYIIINFRSSIQNWLLRMHYHILRYNQRTKTPYRVAVDQVRIYNELYNITKASRGSTLRTLWKIEINFEIFTKIIDIWSFHVRHSSIKIPRNQELATFSSETLFKYKLKSESVTGLCVVWKRIYLVLLVLTVSLLAVNHFLNRSKFKFILKYNFSILAVEQPIYSHIISK